MAALGSIALCQLTGPHPPHPSLAQLFTLDLTVATRGPNALPLPSVAAACACRWSSTKDCDSFGSASKWLVVAHDRRHAFFQELREAAFQDWQASLWRQLKEAPDPTALRLALPPGCTAACHTFAGTPASCTRQDCPDFHDPALTTLAADLGLPGFFPTKPCKQFLQSGQCPWGDACTYTHVPAGCQLCTTCDKRRQDPQCRLWHPAELRRWVAFNTRVKQRALAANEALRSTLGPAQQVRSGCEVS